MFWKSVYFSQVYQTSSYNVKNSIWSEIWTTVLRKFNIKYHAQTSSDSINKLEHCGKIKQEKLYLIHIINSRNQLLVSVILQM